MEHVTAPSAYGWISYCLSQHGLADPIYGIENPGRITYRPDDFKHPRRAYFAGLMCEIARRRFSQGQGSRDLAPDSVFIAAVHSRSCSCDHQEQEDEEQGEAEVPAEFELDDIADESGPSGEDVRKNITGNRSARAIHQCTTSGAHHPIGITATEAEFSSLQCDVCDGLVHDINSYDGDIYYHCDICMTGNFDICNSCFTQGKRCLSDDHAVENNVRYLRDRQPVLLSNRIGIFVEAMQTRKWFDAPLSVTIEMYLELANIEEHPLAAEIREADLLTDFTLPPTSGNTAAGFLRLWAKTLLLLRKDILIPKLKQVLLPVQLASVKLLHEWWISAIQEVEPTAGAIAGLIAASVKPVSHERARVIAQLASSEYHDHLFRLFVAEFSIPTDLIRQHQVQSSTLFYERTNAAVRACAQRIGFLTARHFSSEPIWFTGNSYDSLGLVRIWQDVRMMHREHTMDCDITRVRLARNLAMEPAHLLYLEDFARGGTLLGPMGLTPTLQPCPWIYLSEIKNELPFYLWDTFEQKTVCAYDLEPPPLYTAISHTWGRWRTEGLATIAGVPWKVPRNTRFEVDQLPSILTSVPTSTTTRYVWLDLVCIPQKQLDDDQKQIMIDEIARQAIIFSNATFVIAWLSDLEDFGDLIPAVNYLSLDVVKRAGISEATLETMKFCVYSEEMRRPPRRMPLVRAGSSEKELLIHEWFTSLWTLQEACLRPDMYLCCRDWSLLSLPDKFGVPTRRPLSLDGVLAVIERYRSGHTQIPAPWSCYGESAYREFLGWKELLLSNPHVLPDFWHYFHEQKKIQQAPQAALALNKLVEETSLTRLLYLTRLEILWLGDMRFCKRNRAQAIMSAASVTDWYSELTEEQHGSEENMLVLGRYPLTFINNFRREIPDGAFFNLPVIDRRLRAFADSISNTNDALPAPIGTILPFGKDPSVAQRIQGMNNDSLRIESHSSLSQWCIRSDGSVHIPRAAILASNQAHAEPESSSAVRQTSGTQDLGQVRVYSLEDLSMDPSTPFVKSPWDESTDIHTWIAKRAYPCIAVVTHLYSGRYVLEEDEAFTLLDDVREDLLESSAIEYMTCGILFREVRKNVMVSYGKFESRHDVKKFWPQAEEVDWTVL